MTRGETIVYNKENFKLKDGYAEFPISHLPKRMPKQQAYDYYNRKLWKAWEELGYGKVETESRRYKLVAIGRYKNESHTTTLHPALDSSTRYPNLS